MYTSEEKWLVALHFLLPAPYPFYKQLKKQCRSYDRIHELTERDLLHYEPRRRKKYQQLISKVDQRYVEQVFQELRQKEIVAIPYTSAYYPELLRQVYDPPAVLYAKGQLQYLKKRKLAIVGARKATNYTWRALQQLMHASFDVGIVSGLAAGADRMAHECAISIGLPTIAILGHGFDYCYPKSNEALAQYMMAHELVLSEYPPSYSPKRWMFPMRNRIISGLSEAIIVSEARIKSGTMSTVDYGLNHGRTIFAIPGPIDSVLSEGPHKLIDEGATPLYAARQIMSFLRENEE